MNCCAIRASTNLSQGEGQTAMFKTILAPISGTDSDMSVLSMSLRIASAAGGHIECLRVRPDPAGLIAGSAQLLVGAPMILADTMAAVEREATSRTAAARANFDRFCRRENISIANEPSGPGAVTAAWREETGDEFDRLTAVARYHDIVVLPGARDRIGGLPVEAAGEVIMGGGRAVLLASDEFSKGPFNRIAIAWKDCPEAARAVNAAMPLLEAAHQIDVLSVCEADERAAEDCKTLDDLVRYLRWHGLSAHTQFMVPEGRTPADAVLDHAKHDAADLLVMGAYGHSRMREFIFGGFTERVLKGVDLPVLLFH